MPVRAWDVAGETLAAPAPVTRLNAVDWQGCEKTSGRARPCWRQIVIHT